MRVKEMLSGLEVKVEDCAHKIAIADVAITKAGQDTKFVSKRLKGVMPNAID